MVNISTFGSSLAPGVSFTQTVFDVIPEPLTNHAISYLFVTVPGSEWSEGSADEYSLLEPLVPTPISSLADYLEKIGGTVPLPATDYAAYISYKAVENFYLNSGGSGVLYVIRTVVTPRVELTLDAGAANSLYFILQIDGVYYGSIDTGLTDSENRNILAIPTTGIDIADNTYDIIAFLEGNEVFNNGYVVIQDPTQITSGIFSIASRTTGSVPTVDTFEATSDPTFATPFITGGTAVTQVLTRELNFKLNPNETVYNVDGNVFNSTYYARLDLAGETNPGEFTYFNGLTDAGIDGDPEYLSAIISQYLITELGVTAGANYSGVGSAYQSVDLGSTPPADVYVAIYDNQAPYASVTETAGALATRDTDTRLLWYQASDIGGGLIHWINVPVTSVALTPRSVQTYALNVNSPTNRFLITTNGADVQEHREDGLPKVITAFDNPAYRVTEKTAIDRAYETITAPAGVPTVPTLLTGNLFNHDLVFSLQVESLNGSRPYIWPGIASNGAAESKFYNFFDDTLSLSTAFAQPSVTDYTFTILNSVNEINLLPGFLLCPEAFAAFSTAQSVLTAVELRDDRIAVASALHTVASTRNWFALVDDNPDTLNVLDSTSEFNAITTSIGSPLGHLGFYYPYVETIDNVVLPASAFVAGIAHARYTNDSFVEPPAGVTVPLANVLRPKYTLSRPQLEVNSPIGMNAIVPVPNSGVVVFGARTTATNSPLQFVNQRVIVNVALESLRNSFDSIPFTAIRTTNSLVFTTVRNIAIGVLQDLFEQGALIGASPEEAYQVICDSSNNSNTTLSQGIVFCDIILAPASTLERLEIRTTVTSAGQVQTVVNL